MWIILVGWCMTVALTLCFFTGAQLLSQEPVARGRGSGPGGDWWNRQDLRPAACSMTDAERATLFT